LFPLVSLAAGLVPCGGAGEPGCQMCYFVTLIQNIFGWLVTILSIVVALIFIFAGFKLVTSGGNQSEKSAAKSLITSAFIGFVIVLAAWILIDLGIKALLPGTTGATRIGPWNTIQCADQPVSDASQASAGLANGAVLTSNCSPATPPATGYDCSSQQAACTAAGGTSTVNTTDPANPRVDCAYPPSAYTGSCNEVTDPSNACSPANLSMFGARAQDASIICNKESGGAPVKSGSDLCCGPSGNCSGAPSFSGGYFQVNILSNAASIPGCTPRAFFNSNGSSIQGNCVRRNANNICTGWSCEITDMAMYNTCMKVTTDAALNFQIAKTLFDARGFQPWANSARLCSISF